MLALDEVGLTYPGGGARGGTRALDGLSLAVRPGEFASLLGPSGCGKSTALRLIAGLLRPTGGALAMPGPRPKIGFVFQDPTLMPWADALANVALPLRLGSAPVAKREARERAAAALERVGLAGFERAYPRELSGGMRMRAALARALVIEPDLLLMDEPFAALDEITRQRLGDELLALVAGSGRTVVFVTHSVFEAAYLSGRLLVMTPRPGRLAGEVSIDAPPWPRGEAWRSSPGYADACARARALLRGSEP